MIDLIEYGFTKTATTEDDRYTEYEGHGYTVTIYNYLIKTFDGSEVAHNTFTANSQQFSSRSRPAHELSDWIKEKKILKTIKQ